MVLDGPDRTGLSRWTVARPFFVEPITSVDVFRIRKPVFNKQSHRLQRFPFQDDLFSPVTPGVEIFNDTFKG